MHGWFLPSHQARRPIVNFLLTLTQGYVCRKFSTRIMDNATYFYKNMGGNIYLCTRLIYHHLPYIAIFR